MPSINFDMSRWNTSAVILRPIGNFLYLYLLNGVMMVRSSCTSLHMDIPQYPMIWSIAVANRIPPQVCSSCRIVGMGHGLRLMAWFSRRKSLTTRIALPFLALQRFETPTWCHRTSSLRRHVCTCHLRLAWILACMSRVRSTACHKMVLRLPWVGSQLPGLWMYLACLEKCPRIVWVYFLTCMSTLHLNGFGYHGW